MSNNKQSSVEWLIEQLKEYDFSEEDDTYVIKIQSWVLTEKHEQAKAMHKTEHGKTWDDAMENMKARGGNDMRAYTDFDDYYAETYGGKNE